MPALYDYRLFVSHAWRYGTDYDRLIGLLDDASYFSYYNYSAPQEKPLFPPGTPASSSKIAALITQKINPSQVTLVISGMYATYSDWMKYEVDESLRLGKPILAIKPWGQERVPSYLQNAANEIVGWNTNSIVSAIRRLV